MLVRIEISNNLYLLDLFLVFSDTATYGGQDEPGLPGTALQYAFQLRGQHDGENGQRGSGVRGGTGRG